MHNPTDMRKRLLILIAALAPLLGATAQTFLLRSPEPVHRHLARSHRLHAPVLAPRAAGHPAGLQRRLVRALRHRARQSPLQGEVNFSQRGWTERDGTYSRRLTYVEVPLLMNLFWGNGCASSATSGRRPPSSSATACWPTTSPAEDRNARLERPDHWFDYGVTLGLGMEVAARRQCFQLEVRANYSLSTVFQSKQQYDFSNHMNLALNLGWMIRVNKDK